MRQEKQKGLTVTPRSENYSQWYTDVVRKAELADYSPVKGAMVIRPYGYALWENVQRPLDQKFKETGHQNAYFPVFIPMSFLEREAEHVAGFSPELAVVTHAGGKELEEPLAVRPTSETIINEMFSRWVQSYKDLPLLINQWCNVVRWELRPRLFLRTTEFLWQEGHTAHATEQEAEEEARMILNIYSRFADEFGALSVIRGQKSDSERFAGAVRTYTIEAMMGDLKALQAGTSHFLGQNFARAFNIQFRNKENQHDYAWQTSWGLSTRMVGAIVMAHGDDQGLVLPPAVAPYQVVLIPVLRKGVDREPIMETCRRIMNDLKENQIRATLDDREDVSPGFKFNDWEMRGVPLRIEIGPKDVAKGSVVLARRDKPGREGKSFAEQAGLSRVVAEMLVDIQQSLYDRALAFREAHTREVDDYNEFKAAIEVGFASAHWCGNQKCEAQIKEQTRATIRCIPFAQSAESGKCILCGATSQEKVIFARAY